MRLAQLARKLDIPKNEIIKFLSSKDISIETHGNTKVEDPHVKLIEKHFVQQEAEKENEPETSSKKIDAAIEKSLSYDEQLSEKDENSGLEGAKETETKPLSEVQDKTVEVIRPKKVKLQGIKVLGKIDLPEPIEKDKEEKEEGAAQQKPEEEVAPKKHIRKESRKTYKKRDRKPRQELSFEEKQKREEQKRVRQEKKRKKEIKEKKKRYYEEKIASKVSPSNKFKKKKKKETLKTDEKPVVKHKNIFRRFWAWLNGEYDRF